MTHTCVSCNRDGYPGRRWQRAVPVNTATFLRNALSRLRQRVIGRGYWRPSSQFLIRLRRETVATVFASRLLVGANCSRLISTHWPL